MAAGNVLFRTWRGLSEDVSQRIGRRPISTGHAQLPPGFFRDTNTRYVVGRIEAKPAATRQYHVYATELIFGSTTESDRQFFVGRFTATEADKLAQIDSTRANAIARKDFPPGYKPFEERSKLYIANITAFLRPPQPQAAAAARQG